MLGATEGLEFQAELESWGQGLGQMGQRGSEEARAAEESGEGGSAR